MLMLEELRHAWRGAPGQLRHWGAGMVSLKRYLPWLAHVLCLPVHPYLTSSSAALGGKLTCTRVFMRYYSSRTSFKCILMIIVVMLCRYSAGHFSVQASGPFSCANRVQFHHILNL